MNRQAIKKQIKVGFFVVVFLFVFFIEKIKCIK